MLNENLMDSKDIIIAKLKLAIKEFQEYDIERKKYYSNALVELGKLKDEIEELRGINKYSKSYIAMKDELGDRMKSYYENRSKTFLARRTPVIIRLDGKAFHTFTRGFNKPFDEAMCNAMQETMKYLCENIQGCVLGYTQSDEITLVLIDYQKLTTDAWFDYNVQKICSVAASMATLIFNRRFQEQIVELSYNGKLDDDELTSSYKRSLKTGAMFDALTFQKRK